MRDVLVSSVNVPTAASMSAQVSARSNRVAGDDYVVSAGSDQDTLSLKNQSKFKTSVAMKTEKKPIESAPTQGTTEVSFNEAEKSRTAEKNQAQLETLNRELLTDAYKASAYATHGNKGNYVDFST